MDRHDRHTAAVAAAFLLLAAALLIYQVLHVSPLLPNAVEISAEAPSVFSSQPESTEESPSTVSAQINLSTATLEELCTVPGIGSVLADRIIEYRDTYGPFSSLEELLEVKGIGDKLYATLCQYVYLE